MLRRSAGGSAGANLRRRLAAADVEDQAAQDRQPLVEEARIDPALEAAPRVAGQRQRLSGAGDPVGGEIGDLEHDVGRAFADPRILAAHDPADVVHARIIRDHRHERLQRIVLAVQRQHGLARPRRSRRQSAAQLGDIVGMAGPAEVQHHVVRDVDQRRDRPLPGGLQPPLHPLGRRAVAKAPDRSPVESRAALRILDPHRYRTGKAALDLRHCKRLQRAYPGRSKIARDPANAHAVLPVGRNRNVEHLIVEPCISRVGGADRRVRGKLDDAAMVVAKLKLARRAHHAAALDPADGRDLQGHVDPRHIGARRAEHADHPRARIRRAAHHLHLAVAGVDGEHLQLVGLRVLAGRQDPRNSKRRQCLGWVVHSLDLEADRRQLVGNFLPRRVRFEMRLSQLQRELHAPTPPDRVGTSSARNP